MYTQIDKLVSEINFALKQPQPTILEVRIFFELINADSISQAVALRSILESYTVDMNQPNEVRIYALQQLEALPDF